MMKLVCLNKHGSAHVLPCSDLLRALERVSFIIKMPDGGVGLEGDIIVEDERPLDGDSLVTILEDCVLVVFLQIDVGASASISLHNEGGDSE